MDSQVKLEEVIAIMGEKLKRAEIEHSYAIAQIQVLHNENKRLHEALEGLAIEQPAQKDEVTNS